MADHPSETDLLKMCRDIMDRDGGMQFTEKMFHLCLSRMGILNFQNPVISGEDRLVRLILPRLLDTDRPILFDVGANVGEAAKLLHKHFPHATIHCFEPHPLNFQQLVAAAPAGAKCHNLALGARPGRLNLYDRTDQPGGSSHASLYEAVITDLHKRDATSFEVEVRTLDEVMGKEGVDHIDFLKIDTEGHEFAVLQGAEQALARGAIPVVQFEFNEMHVISRVFLRDFRELLKGYELFRLLPRGLLRLGTTPYFNELFAYQNVLAVRAERLERLK